MSQPNINIGPAKNVISGFSILSMENLNYLANSIQGFSWVSLECMLGVGVGLFFLEKRIETFIPKGQNMRNEQE